MNSIQDRKVILCSGHMIDLPSRPYPRFPPEKEDAVRRAMVERLETWEVGPGSIAICGGARGADMLFAELCIERGATVRMCLALPVEDFIDRSVRIPETNWETRFRTLLPRCEVSVLDTVPGEGDRVFERANRWMLSEALGEAGDRNFLALLVWDEDEQTGKTGGTAHFFRELRKESSEAFIINPIKTEGGTRTP